MPAAECVAEVAMDKKQSSATGPSTEVLGLRAYLLHASFPKSSLLQSARLCVLFYQGGASGNVRVGTRALRGEGIFSGPEGRPLQLLPPWTFSFQCNGFLLRRKAVSLFTEYFLMGQEDSYHPGWCGSVD